MDVEARMGAAKGFGRKAGGAEWEAPPATGLGVAHRQNVIEKGPKFVLRERLSKIKDEPTMLMKISQLENDKMPDAMMSLNRKDLDGIQVNFMEMC